MKNLEEKARLHKALGEPIRLKIVEYLMDKGKCTCVCHLSKLLKRDQSVIFRHMQILKEAGILDTSKEAKYLLCCVKNRNKIKRLLEA